MPSPVVIRAENVSKKYVISHLAKQQTIRDAMHHGLRLLWRRLRWNAQLQREEFWALKDVSFEVKQGEVLGIIGRNGAGKSTLLKILSRITDPTNGRISINGRIASLLEVGTGFHPELTGSENIYLNGAILGMSRAEVKAKFDEIVAFAEIERFIDTPVKRYSSGMYVRLAFAVAAHLEPEVLIVDEVLAVGDAQFQKKCVGAMSAISHNHGLTVLFVSHNLNSLRQLCSHGLVLKNGKNVLIGPIQEATQHYTSLESAAHNVLLYSHPKGAAPQDSPTIQYAQISHPGAPSPQIAFGSPLQIILTIHLPAPVKNITIGFTISDSDNIPVFTSHQNDIGNCPSDYDHGSHKLSVAIPQNPLMPGTYNLTIGIVDRNWQIIALARECIHFEVIGCHQRGTPRPRPGKLVINLPWNHSICS